MAGNPRIAAALSAVMLAAVLLPASADASTGGSISVSPQTYVVGQDITITGSVGAKGKREVILQRVMWGTPLTVAKGSTNASGHFAFVTHGQAMEGVPYVVYAPSLRRSTPRAPVTTVNPNLTLNLGGRTSIDVTATAKDSIAHEGRKIQLQVRNADFTWTVLSTGVEAADGTATFDVGPTAAGFVYRAVAREFEGLAPFESFPVYVTSKASQRVMVQPTPPSTDVSPLEANSLTHAGSVYKWWPVQWQYDWEFGEPVSPWTEFVNGTGRLAFENGMLRIQSGALGKTALGSTTATLTKGAASTGRWEVSAAEYMSTSSARKDPQVRFELVPVSQLADACPTSKIVLAQFTPHHDGVTFGAVNNGSTWAQTLTSTDNSNWSFNKYAVEVTGKRISFFVNAKVVATLTTKAALVKGPLAVRLEINSTDSTTAMNPVDLGIDWVRHWTLANGKTQRSSKIRKVPEDDSANAFC